MKTIGLEFLPNPGRKAEGLNDAGIATFRDKPFASVARETGQNSRDVRVDQTRPVRLTFDVIKVNAPDFPSITEFRSAAKICLDKALKRNNEKEIGFFRQAVKVLAEPEISVLCTADFNTKGVRGPCEEGRPFHTLAKADGMSVKDEINSGGSFGIGKSSVFAISDIQTAIFSTRYTDDAGTDQVLCMGKTMFISHTGEDGQEKGREGYWGKTEGYMPLDNAADIPQWLQRTEQGTSIFSVCMRSHRTDWRYEMAAALLMNFFCAIQRNEMEFEIDNGFLRINSNTILALFSDAQVNQAVDQLNARKAFDDARTLYSCLVDEKTLVRTLAVPGLGDINMRVLLRDGLGYTIGIVRNGMYITNNLANFDEPFKRFPLYREFSAIIEPANKEEGEWFKRLENPRHDDLSAEGITDPALREQGEKAFKKLASMIRHTLQELAKSKPTSSMELEELNDFFATEQVRIEDENATEPDPRSFKPTSIKRTPPRVRPKVPQPGGEDVDVPGPRPEPDPNPDPPNPRPHVPGPSPRPQPAIDPVDLQKERNLLPDAGRPAQRRILFTPTVTGEVRVSVQATGLSTPEGLSLVSSSTGKLSDGTVVLSCEAGKRVSLTVEFDTPYTGPIELSAVHIQNKMEVAI
ncbi:hypothetical protein CN128_09945 [Sinorhizobium meliloti]|uniref:hypothetical protein n=1 Tax=Rhizobium meliloti TaxID=382 RepID=UPI000FDCCDF3|nr:hypothetical protein [Sinorhizobium meliloti]RVM58405.1 hypothetical protein CN128_09945 [Sinorhizobium meliloti]